MLPALVTLFTNLLQTKKGVGEKVQSMLLSLQPIRKSPALGAIRDLYNHSFNNVTLVFPSKVSQTPYFHILYYVSTCIFLHICVVVPELTCVLVCCLQDIPKPSTTQGCLCSLLDLLSSDIKAFLVASGLGCLEELLML